MPSKPKLPSQKIEKPDYTSQKVDRPEYTSQKVDRPEYTSQKVERPRFPSQKLDQYMLRLPDGMRERIKAAAAHNGRSMNAEIVHALTYWLEIEIPYDVELGPRTDARKVGKADWEDSRRDREQDYKREIERSIWLMQRLLKDIRVDRGDYNTSPEEDGEN